MAHIAIVGAGVVGLTCGVRLLEGGHSVTIFAARRTPETTSDRAAAVFTPFRAEDPRALQWTGVSFGVFRDLSQSPADGHGVSMAVVRDYLDTMPEKQPWWSTLVERYRVLTDVPQGHTSAVEAVMPRMNMLEYMPYLERRFSALSGVIVEETVRVFEDLHRRGHAIVINCSGLGARQLARDDAVRPMRGQVVHVPNDIGLEDGLAYDGPAGEVTYLVPFADHIVLGGTYEEDAWEAQTDDATLSAIIARCRQLLRQCGHERWAELGVRRLRAWAGLRPARIVDGNPESVRLDVETHATGTVVHNYGHGRVGVTLSWGTAAEVARLVEEL